jgi:uncharacterized membrane protein YjjP (DUF1212 family)
MSTPPSPQFHPRSLSDHNDFLEAKHRNSMSKADLNISVSNNEEKSWPDERNNASNQSFIGQQLQYQQNFPHNQLTLFNPATNNHHIESNNQTDQVNTHTQQGYQIAFPDNSFQQPQNAQNSLRVSNFQNSYQNHTYQNYSLSNKPQTYSSHITQHSSIGSEMVDQIHIDFNDVDDDILNNEASQNNQNNDQDDQNVNDMDNIDNEDTTSIQSEQPSLGSHYGTIVHSEIEVQLPDEVLDRIQPHEMPQFLFWSQRIEKSVQNSKHHKLKQSLLVNLVNTLAASGASTHRIEFLVGKVSRALQTRCQVMLLPNIWIMTFINSGKSVNPETSHTLASRLSAGLDVYRCELVESFVGEILRLAAIEKLKRKEMKIKREKERERRKLEQTLAKLNEQVFNGQGGSLGGDSSNKGLPTEDQVHRTWWGNVYDTITGLPKGWKDAQKETDDKLFAFGFEKATNKFGPNNYFKEKQHIQMTTIRTNHALHANHNDALYSNTVNALQQPLHRVPQDHTLKNLFEPLPLSSDPANSHQVSFEQSLISAPPTNQLTSPMSDDYVHIDILPVGGAPPPIPLSHHPAHFTQTLPTKNPTSQKLTRFQHPDLHSRNQRGTQNTPQKPQGLQQLYKPPDNISINSNTNSLHHKSPFNPVSHPPSIHSNQRAMYNVNNNNMFTIQGDQQTLYKSWLYDSNDPRSPSPRDETQDEPPFTGPYPPPPPPPSPSPSSSDSQPKSSIQIKPSNGYKNTSSGHDLGSQFEGEYHDNQSQMPSIGTFNFPVSQQFSPKLSAHTQQSSTLAPVDFSGSQGNLEKDVMLETLDSLATDALKVISQIRLSEKPNSPKNPQNISNLNFASSSFAMTSPMVPRVASFQPTPLVKPSTKPIDPSTLDPSFFLPDSSNPQTERINPQNPATTSFYLPDPNSLDPQSSHQMRMLNQNVQPIGTETGPSFSPNPTPTQRINIQPLSPSTENDFVTIKSQNNDNLSSSTQSQGAIAPPSAAERTSGAFSPQGAAERVFSTLTTTKVTSSSPSQFPFQLDQNPKRLQQIDQLNHDQSDTSDDSDGDSPFEVRNTMVVNKGEHMFEQNQEQLQPNNAGLELSRNSPHPQTRFSNFGEINANNFKGHHVLFSPKNDQVSPNFIPNHQNYQSLDNDVTPLLTQPQLSYEPSLTFDNSTAKQIGTFLNDFPEYPVEEHSAFMTASLATYHDAYTQKTKNELSELANLQVRPRHRDQMLLDLSKPTFNIDINNPASLSVALSQIGKEQSLYPLWAFLLSLLVMGPAAAYSFFGGGQREVIASFFLSWIVVLFEGLAQKNARFASIQMFITPFLVAFFCRLIRAYWYPNLCMYPTTLSALIWLLPGLSITNSVIEISAGSRVSGATRFITTLFATLQMGFGMALGNGLVMWTSDDVKAPCIADVPSGWSVPAFLLVSVCMNISLAAHPRQWLGMTLSSAIALFGGSWIGAQFPSNISLDLTTLSCAILIGVFASLYSRLISSEQPITYMLSGIIFLVPGSITLKGMFELFSDEGGSGATSFFITMLRITSAIAVGLQSARFFALDTHVKHAPIYKVLLNSLRKRFGSSHGDYDNHEIIVEELAEISKKKRKSTQYENNNINLSNFDPNSTNRNTNIGIQRRRVMDGSNLIDSPRDDDPVSKFGQTPQLYQQSPQTSHFKPTVTPSQVQSPIESSFPNQSKLVTPQFQVAQSDILYDMIPPTEDNTPMLQLYQNDLTLNKNHEQPGPKLHLDTVLSEGGEHVNINAQNDQPIGVLSLATFPHNRSSLTVHSQGLGSAADKNNKVVSTTSVFSRPQNTINNGQTSPKQEGDIMDFAMMTSCVKNLMSNQSKQELLINTQNDMITQLQAQNSLLQAQNSLLKNPEQNTDNNNNQPHRRHRSDFVSSELNLSRSSSKSRSHSRHRELNYETLTKSINNQNHQMQQNSNQSRQNNSNNNQHDYQNTITSQHGSIIRPSKAQHPNIPAPTITKIPNSVPLSVRRGSQPAIHPVIGSTPSRHDSRSREVNNSNTVYSTHTHHTLNNTIHSGSERGGNGSGGGHHNYEDTVTQIQNFQHTIRMNKAFVEQVEENDDDDDPEVSDDNGDIVPM